ncbi:MAG: glutamate 5-kinase, partial [Schwartzia sp.]|nr:glutamate 5-kinase [Schwartzia sp. (in: firmicutes)]
MNIRDGLKSAKRVVVKVGTSTITRENGASNLARMEEIVREIVGLKDEGREMVLVTSGAIAAGMNRMGLK